MRLIPHAAVVGLCLSFASTAAHAQAPTPTPTLASSLACPADIRFYWDVTSVAGADGVRWRIHMGPPGSTVDAAQLVDNDPAPGAIGSLNRNLRAYGPVLDGTRYFVRVRAFDGSDPLAEISQPAVFDQSTSPDGMFSAVAGSTPGQIRLEWNLTGAIGACADRIAWEVKKAAFADLQAADPAALVKGSASGVSGSRTIDVSAHGAGTYHVRLVARHGGDNESDDVGRWGAARQVTVSAQAVAVALTVSVEDATYSACLGGGAVAAPGATVRVTGTGFDQSLTADASGRAVFNVASGVVYTITATSTRCLGSVSAIFMPTGGPAAQTLRLPDCFHPGADLRLATAATWPGGTALSPYPMSFTVSHSTFGGPTRPADLRVERVGAGTTAATQVNRTTLGGVCPNAGPRTISIVDPSPPLGTWTYRATIVARGTTSSLTDADPANHAVSRTVGFLAAPTVSVEPTFLNITSFRLQGGAASVNAGFPVALNATTSGQVPREYKAGECGRTFDVGTFRSYAPSPVPTLAFSTAGSKVVCLQMRGSSATSAVVRDTIQVIVPADLNPTVAQTSSTVVGGAPQTYTVTVRNTGGLPASGVVVQNTLPADLTFVSAAIGVPFNVACPRSGATVTCTLPVLGAGQSVTLTIATRLPRTATSGHDLLFTTRVDPSNTIAESSETNNQAAAAARTSALVAPTVEYVVTAPAELSELFRVAQASGLQMFASSSDPDDHACPMFIQDARAPILRIEPKATGRLRLLVRGECQFELFSGRQSGRTELAEGWVLNDVQWELSTMLPLDGFWYYLRELPSKNVLGTRETLFAIVLKSNAGADLTLKSIRLAGPAGKTWRDAFAP